MTRSADPAGRKEVETMFRGKMSLGLRIGVAVLTMALMAYFGYALHAAGHAGPAWVLYGLAVLRGALLAIEVVRKKRRERELAAAMRLEEEEFKREILAKRQAARSEPGEEGEE